MYWTEPLRLRGVLRVRVGEVAAGVCRGIIVPDGWGTKAPRWFGGVWADMLCGSSQH